jgi:hypothetical protein
VRRLRRGEVLLGVAGRASANDVARAARSITIDGQPVQVTVAGNTVEVRGPVAGLQ